MGNKNRFGGIAGSNYTPMTEIEQEAISRLVEAKDMVVHIKGWGRVDNPRIIYGDLRLGIAWRMNFNKPAAPTPVHWFDLELRTRAGVLLYSEKQSTMYGGKPISVAAGMFMDMVWDIAVFAMDPKVVKMVMPGAIGFTSRFQDKDTGELTLFGNTKMSSEDRHALVDLRKREAESRADTQRLADKAVKKAKEDGVIVDPTKMV